MRDFLEQIAGAVKHNLYYVALFAALAVPDICGAMQSADGQASKAKYIGWFNRYVAPKYKIRHKQSFTAEDCYFFRCSSLHQGSSQHPRGTYSRILFVEPAAAGGIVFHNNVMMDALNIDIRVFCSDMIAGAEQWLSEVESMQDFQRNQTAFLTRYPNGLPPYIVGVPVIS